MCLYDSTNRSRTKTILYNQPKSLDFGTATRIEQMAAIIPSAFVALSFQTPEDTTIYSRYNGHHLNKGIVSIAHCTL